MSRCIIKFSKNPSLSVVPASNGPEIGGEKNSEMQVSCRHATILVQTILKQPAMVHPMLAAGGRVDNARTGPSRGTGRSGQVPRLPCQRT
mmetsp:Transcript_114164/g.197353  ORF Transcript_114164/g.197353 Transcript_114164/m.197353 type:complete len:90 (+) Transcript_114164:17-286(+)